MPTTVPRWLESLWRIGHRPAEQPEQGASIVIGGAAVAPQMPARDAPLHHNDLSGLGQRPDRLHRPTALGGPVTRVDIDMP